MLLVRLWEWFGKIGVLSELLYVDDSVLVSETIEGLGKKAMKWNEAFEHKSLMVNFLDPKVMVSGSITNNGCA